jgi:hypothetical protein
MRVEEFKFKHFFHASWSYYGEQGHHKESKEWKKLDWRDHTKVKNISFILVLYEIYLIVFKD